MVIPAHFVIITGSDPWVDESLESLEERAQEQKEADTEFATEDKNTSLEVPSPESVTYVDYDNPFAFIGECCGTTQMIHQLSPLAWVSVGGEIYILECVGAGFIRVEPLTDPEGDFPTLSRASHHLTWKSRVGSQVPGLLHPGYMGQGHGQDVQTFTLPATASYPASAEPRTGYQGVRLLRKAQCSQRTDVPWVRSCHIF